MLRAGPYIKKAKPVQIFGRVLIIQKLGYFFSQQLLVQQGDPS